jgi:hypothetical protein
MRLSLPALTYNELYFLEVETDTGADPDRTAFLAAMRGAAPGPRGYTVTLNPAALRYLRAPYGAIQNSLDIVKGGGGPEDPADRKAFKASLMEIARKLAR